MVAGHSGAVWVRRKPRLKKFGARLCCWYLWTGAMALAGALMHIAAGDWACDAMRRAADVGAKLEAATCESSLGMRRKAVVME